MRVILKNLFTALRRYPAAVALNVAGLAVAFAAFLVILIEVRFEYGFDTCHPGSERIFRVEMRSPELADSWFTMLNYPLISDLAGSSAHIEAASALEMLGPGLELEVPEPNGERRLFRETVKRCNSSFVRVLGLRLTEGDRAFKRPVRIGRQNPQYYEVLDGLEPGERVIVSGYENYGANDVLILNR